MTNVRTNSAGACRLGGPGAPLTMSRPATRILSSIAVIAALVAACSDPGWQELNIPDGGFRIMGQGPPLVEKHELATPVGTIIAHWYSIGTRDAAYGVGYADWPEQVIRATEPRKIFSILREGWIKRIDGKLQGDGTDIKLENKYPGMEFIAWGKLKDRDAYVRGRFYLVDNRLYQVVVFGNKSAMPASDINRFLNSFKLAPRRETQEITIGPPKDEKTK
jgi:hypothetical protein